MSTPVIDDAGVGSSPVPDKPARATGPQGAETSRQPKSAGRITFVKWLRKVHGWIGLWGAALGLLFGTTGFLLNHRGGPLRVSTGEPVVSTVQVPLPQPAPETPRELAKWLKQELKLAGKPGRMQNEPAHRVAWGERSIMQPEHWEISFASPHENTAADYWVGNDFVTVKRTENAFLATLTNLHKGVGMSVGWVLVVDTLAGSLILLSLTGVLLWTELNRRKTVGAVLVIGCIVTMLCAGLL
jgi:hypothetical protein